MKRPNPQENSQPRKKRPPRPAVLTRTSSLTKNNPEELCPDWIDLFRSPFTVGRNPECDVQISNFLDSAGTPKAPVHTISRLHGKFIWRKNIWHFENLGTNGSFVQRQTAKPRLLKKGKTETLQSGDRVIFGRPQIKTKQFGTVDNVCIYEFNYKDELESEPDIDMTEDGVEARLKLANQKEKERKEKELQKVKELELKQKEETLAREMELLRKRSEKFQEAAKKVQQEKAEIARQKEEEAERRKKEEQINREKQAVYEKQEAELREKEQKVRAEKEKLDKQRAEESAKLLREKKELEEKEAKLAEKAEGLEKEKEETKKIRQKELEDIQKQKAELKKKLDAELKTLDEFNCAICLSICYNPIALNCSHNFCERCIIPWLEEAGESCCPNCRAKFTHRTSVSTQIKNIIEAALQSVGTDEQKEEYQESKDEHEIWVRQEAAKKRQAAGRGRGRNAAVRGRGGRRARNQPHFRVVQISDDSDSSEEESSEEESEEESEESSYD